MAVHDDVLIVGSGLAGVTAAMYLSEAGKKVRILEASSHAGGRTSSWTERGMPIESGLHRFLGFYTALPDVLQKAGVSLDDILCWEDEIEIRIPDGIHTTLALAPLHKPLQTFWNVLGHNNFISPADKASLAKMFAAGIADYGNDPIALDHITVAEYAKRHGVTKQAVQHILIAITEGIFFLPIDRYSMYNLMGLFVPYIKSMHKLRVGAFMGGMTEVMMQPMIDYALARNGEIQYNTHVEQLVVMGGRVRGVVAGGREYRAKHVIVATSLFGAQHIIMASLPKHPAFEDMMRLQTMPAVTFQIELSKPAIEVDRTTFGPMTSMVSFAEQSRTTFRNSPGRLSIILSPPERFVDMGADEIRAIVEADAKRLGISLRGIIKDYRKVTLPHDFYSLGIGSERLRPLQKTSVPGLTLAGDYTKQPYLATMEGAVVSGQRAAEITAKDLH